MPYYKDAIIAYGVVIDVSEKDIDKFEKEVREYAKDYMDITVNDAEKGDEELFVCIENKYLPVNNNLPVSIFDTSKFELTTQEKEELEIIASIFDGELYLDNSVYVFYYGSEK